MGKGREGCCKRWLSCSERLQREAHSATEPIHVLRHMLSDGDVRRTGSVWVRLWVLRSMPHVLNRLTFSGFQWLPRRAVPTLGAAKGNFLDGVAVV